MSWRPGMTLGLRQENKGSFPTMGTSSALAPHEAFADLEIPEGSQGQGSALAEQLME